MNEISLYEAMDSFPPTPQTFPKFAHSRYADFISVYVTQEDFYTERIDELLTIHRSVESQQLVGCTIKGISLLARNVTNMIGIEDRHIKLVVLIMVAAGARKVSPVYEELGKRWSDVNVPEELLLT